MYPILFEIGPFSLHTYGLAMAVAFGLGIWLVSKRAEQRGIGHKFAYDLSFLILIFSLLGARFTYVFTHLDEFTAHPFDAISPIQHDGKIGIAGLVLLGGVIAGFATAYVYSRKKKHDFLVVSDIFIPSLALGIAIGRLGCFFNGCCFGLPTDMPWCAHFPHDSIAGDVFPDQCIHPTQLYETLYMLIMFGIYLWYDKTPRPTGKLTGLFLFTYGIGRFYIEGLRWYEGEMILFQSADFRFTFSRLISAAMILIGIYLFTTRKEIRK